MGSNIKAGLQEPIAIVGIGCRFPGGANTPSKLWDILSRTPNLAKVIPQDRFSVDRFYHPLGSHHGTTNVRETYFLDEDVRRFDAGFFALPPPEASAMDPQHRLLLETVYEAMESSGMTIDQLQGSDTAAFVGMMSYDYNYLSTKDVDHMSTYNATGAASSNASARLSYFFDWHGPCMVLDTACSSSLVAVHHAVQTLRAGTSRIAVAAGTNLILSPVGYISETTLPMLSPSGRCQMWDEKADGYARGEGVACLLLKKLSDAIADGDAIECVIRETGINQDGKTRGITMPSGVSQAALIRDTYRRAGLDPRNKLDRCQYFEAHGTGTPAGDPQEAEALDTAFFGDSAARDPNDKLYVGSIKTVIGHTEGTAGLAGVIKACLAIKNGQIPPNLHFNKISATVEPFYRNLQVVTANMRWPELSPGQVRRVSVNSFGFGGTNAHAILESFEGVKSTGNGVNHDVVNGATSEGRVFLPFVLSAASETALSAQVEAYASYLSTSNVAVDIQKLAYTLSCHRSHLPFKTFFLATTQEELRSKMQSSISEGGDKSVIRSAASNRSILGIFTGQGAQWPAMGLELIRSSAHARRIVEELDLSLAELPASDRPPWTLKAQLEASGSDSRVGEAVVSQPLVCAVQILLVILLQDAGVQFKAVVGHSSGEIAAAFAAGFLSHRDAIRIAYYRGLHSKLAQGSGGQQGGMVATGLSYEDALELCQHEDFEGRITVAASNAPTSSTISGDMDAIELVQDVLEDEQTFVRALRVDKAYHSHHMKPASEPFLASVESCSIKITEPPMGAPTWFSSVYAGKTITTRDSLQGEYWTKNLVSPVLFFQAVETALKAGSSYDIALEVGPHPALKGPATDVMKSVIGKEIPYTGTLVRGKNDVQALAATLGSLWSHAGPGSVDFERYQVAMQDDGSRRQDIIRDLPSYPWDHDLNLWTESRETKLWRQQDGHFHDLLGLRCPDGTEEEWRWKNVLHPKELPWLPEHALQGQTVFPATGYICLAMEAAMQIAGGNSHVQLLEMIDFYIPKALAVDDNTGTEILVSMSDIARTSLEITMNFACFSAVGKDASGLVLNAVGKVTVQLGIPVPDILGKRPPPAHSMQSVSSDEFFEDMSKLGFDYGPAFRGMANIERKLGSSRGDILGPPNDDTGTMLLFHPATLDVAVQALILAFSYPGDERLWSLYAPSSIKRVSLVPYLCGKNMAQQVAFECAVTEVAFNKLAGDAEVFQPETGFKSISLEGLATVPFTPATAAHDRNLFAYNKHEVDAPNGVLVSGDRRASKEDIQKGVDCERVAFYYLRTFHEGFSEDEKASLNMPEHHRSLFNYAQYIYDIVQRDMHAYVRKAWINDTYEEICNIMKSYGPNDADFPLMAASGENLAAVVRGQTTMLEHLTKDNKLENYYRYSLGFYHCNDDMAAVVKQIAHRYPNMNVCEVGAGTGGATRRILAELGTAYSSYSYTDVSAGFFAQAQQDFASFQDRLIYKTLDVTVDPTEQGFEQGAYDLVLASNVLHATPNLVATMNNVRKLLRPGGFLVLMEFIDMRPMRPGLIYGGLPGWWVGKDDGRIYSPCITISEWHELLLKCGFSGVDTSTPIHDAQVSPAAVLVSQAVNADFSLLREPSAAPQTANFAKNGELLILGGTKETTKVAVEGIRRKVESRYKSVTHIPSWDNLDVKTVPENVTVLCLTDMDGPFWKNITPKQFDTFTKLLLGVVNVLWVTWGADCDNGDGAMTLGFFRSLAYELPTAQLQILDLEDANNPDGAFIAERLLRLEVASYLKRINAFDKTLYSHEQEIRVRDGKALITRCLSNVEMDNRYNSFKRVIEKDIDLRQSIATLNWNSSESVYTLREEESATLPSVSDYRRLRMDSFLLCSIVTPAGRLYFGLGVDMDTGERVIAASRRNASAISVPRKWTTEVDAGRSTDPPYLSLIMGFFISNFMSSKVPPGGVIIIHEPDAGLASLLSHQLALRGCKVVFTTTDRTMEKKNWVSMHPRIPERRLREALPSSCALFVDLSATSSCPAESAQLSRRIQSILPPLCEKHDSSVVIARESTELLSHDDDAIQDLISKANTFAATALTGVPDGMPLQMVSVTKFLSSPTDVDKLRTIVQWRGETKVPARVGLTSDRNDLFQTDKSYWLLGLAGDLGLSLCDFMIGRGARYIILSSRNPDISDEWIQHHSARGITIAVVKADITDKSSLTAAYEKIKTSMPPVVGVANGTLILRDRGLVNMDLETFHINTRPKVEGTQYLDELFPENTLDWFIAFSSIACTFGNMGQMAYTAANIFMKALIAQRRKRGVAGSVIDISRVTGIGYIEREMKHGGVNREQGMRQIARLKTLGLTAMSETDVHELFSEAIIAGRPDSGLNPEILSGIRIITPAEAKEVTWGDKSRLSHFIQEARTAKLPSVSKVAVVSVKKLLEAAKDAEEQATILRTLLSAKVRDILQVSDSAMDETMPLIDLGVDSLIAVEIRTWFAQEVGADVAVLKILGGPSIEELVEEVMEKLVPSTQEES